MRPSQKLLFGAVVLFIAGFVGVLAAGIVWPPEEGFRAYVAKEAAKVALQLLGVTVVSALVAALVRQAGERSDFARRLRTAYGKAKGCRRRLRRLPAAEQAKELEKLEAVQLDLEDLRDEARLKFGPDSQIARSLGVMEKYLHDVVDAGLPPRKAEPAADDDALQGFVARFGAGSRFDRDFRLAHRSIRNAID